MIGLVAQPWWVNLIALIPPLAYFSWRRGGVALSARQLAVGGVFAASFGFLEAESLSISAQLLDYFPDTRGHFLTSCECQKSFTGSLNRSASSHSSLS